MTERGSDFDAAMMRRAIQLAYGGRGYVEPNPMVGYWPKVSIAALDKPTPKSTPSAHSTPNKRSVQRSMSPWNLASIMAKLRRVSIEFSLPNPPESSSAPSIRILRSAAVV
jgi:hypothetical protein